MLKKTLATLLLLSSIPVPAAPPPISAYGELPQIEFVDLSPNGVLVAVIVRSNGQRSLRIFDGEQMVKNVPVGDAKIRDMAWANDSLLMIDISQTVDLPPDFTADKAEFFSTLFVPLNGDNVEWLFEKQRNISTYSYGWYGTRSIGGKQFGFFGGVELQRRSSISFGTNGFVFKGGHPALFRVDLSDFSAKKVAYAPSEGADRQWLVDDKGDIAATLEIKSGDGSWAITDKKNQTVAKGQSRIGYAALLAFNHDGTKVIYYERDEEEGTRKFYEVSLSGGAPAEFLPGVAVDRWIIDPNSSRLIGYQLASDKFDVRMFNPQVEKQVLKIGQAFPDRLISLKDWTEDFRFIIANTNGNKDSGSWWWVNLKQLTAGQVGLERPTILAENVGQISRIEYTASDGLPMDGILTLPPGRTPKNLPIVMLPHGGPTSEDQPGFDWWAQAIASRGYAVFQPNFRGSTNRDTNFIRAGYGQWGRKMQTDISDGLSHLAKLGTIDPKRACIVGASYGGYAALAGVTLQNGLYRCAVSVAGVSDLSLMVSTDIAESGTDPLLKRNLQYSVGSGKDLKEVSPRRFAPDANAPILLIHGKDDVIVPYKQSEIMASALKNAGKPFDFVTLAEEDHWLSKEKTRIQMLEATIAFIEKHNPADASH